MAAGLNLRRAVPLPTLLTVLLPPIDCNVAIALSRRSRSSRSCCITLSRFAIRVDCSMQISNVRPTGTFELQNWVSSKTDDQKQVVTVKKFPPPGHLSLSVHRLPTPRSASFLSFRFCFKQYIGDWLGPTNRTRGWLRAGQSESR